MWFGILSVAAAVNFLVGNVAVGACILGLAVAIESRKQDDEE